MRDTIPVLEDEQVRDLLASVDVIDTLRRMFAGLAAGRAAQPPQSLTLFPDDSGDVINYSGVNADQRVFGVKLSPYIVQSPRPVVTAWTLLMSMDSGRPLMLCDAKRLTTERTAATTALAVDLLAPAQAARLAVVGTGQVALAHLRHVLPLRNWSQVHVHARSLASLPATRVAEINAIAPAARLVSGLQDAVRDADVILLCTSAGTTVLDPGTLSRPALITSISTNAPRAHEIPPEALAGLQVYCDDRKGAPLSAGEMRIAAEAHGWSPDAILGDLPELVAGTASPPAPGAHIFFRSIGLGLEDIAIATEIHRVHQARQTGRSA